MPKFSLIITTKNRLNDLVITLNKLASILLNEDVECLIYDDGSIDGTYDYLKKNYPNILLFKNNTTKGLIYCRNVLMNNSKGEYVISLDDDLNFLSENPLLEIENYFKSNHQCGVITFRIFWSKIEPNVFNTNLKPHKVRNFAGGAHVWRKSSWTSIPNYPSWFKFYGEEDFASYNLFKKKIEIHFLPSILTHHRVDLRDRKNHTDYFQRMRRSLRAGWYLYLMFIPLKKVPKLIISSIYNQIKNKFFKGEIRIIGVIFLSALDVFFNIKKLILNSNRLSSAEYKDFLEIPSTLLYWKPEDESNL